MGTGKFETVELSSVISAIGQKVDMSGIDAASGIKLGDKGTVLADAFTFQTGEPDVFAGGDAVTGPKFAIDAIAAGKEGAVSIHRFVHEGQTLTLGRDRRDYKPLDKDNVAVAIDCFDSAPRI